MTRKSKREIERAVDSLEESEDPDVGILFTYENAEGETVGPDGEPILEEKFEQAGLIINMGLPETC